jgi:hypothetical protein
MKFSAVIAIAVIAVVANLAMVDATPVLDSRAQQPALAEVEEYEKLAATLEKVRKYKNCYLFASILRQKEEKLELHVIFVKNNIKQLILTARNPYIKRHLEEAKYLREYNNQRKKEKKIKLVLLLKQDKTLSNIGIFKSRMY